MVGIGWTKTSELDVIGVSLNTSTPINRRHIAAICGPPRRPQRPCPPPRAALAWDTLVATLAGRGTMVLGG